MRLRRLLLVALAAAPARLHAQSPVTLERVDSLVVIGQAEQARAALMSWWEKAAKQRPNRAQTQHAVWLRALLTVDPAQASVDYLRLVVEYPGGAYSDRALYRLAQAADARGDAVNARAHLRALLRDYPGSTTRLDAGRLLQSVDPAAEAQLAREKDHRGAAAPTVVAAVPVTNAAPSAPAPPRASTASASAATEPEGPKASSPAAPATPRPAAAKPAPAAPPVDGPWTVQLGAFASSERARAFAKEAQAAGSEVRLVTVPLSRLIRVRTGRFLSQGSAERLRASFVADGMEATVASDADQEEDLK